MPRGPSFSERPTLPVPAVREAPSPRESGKLPIAERRASGRVRIELDVSLGAESHYFTAASFDLSPGGVFVATYRALAIGTELAVEFELPASRVVAKGRVRWERDSSDGAPPGYGIAFEDLSRFDRTLIESFCASRDDGRSTGQASLGADDSGEERALAG